MAEKATKEEFVKWFAETFAGRDDVFGEGYPDPDRPGKYLYARKDGAVDEARLRKHLNGEQHVGVYPIRDNAVKFFAVDFDAPKNAPDPVAAYESALHDARVQKGLLEMAGLFVYVERSRSGNGIHLWGFLSDWVDAETVLNAIRPHLLKSVNLDRIFPVQSAVREGKIGNLIGLPFAGKDMKLGNSMFLDDFNAVISIWELPSLIRTNNPDVIRELAAEAPRTRGTVGKSIQIVGANGATDFELPDGFGRPPQPITGVLKLISEYGCKFMNHVYKNQDKRGTEDAVPEPMWYAALGQFTAFENGEEAARQCSRTRAHEFDAKWANVQQNPPVGCAYIHEHFPEHACKGCPMKAPYHIAERPILELVQVSSAPMRRASLGSHLERVRRRNRGEESPGLKYGIAGLDEVVRARMGELTVIGAMPSMGKTAFLVDAAISFAKQGIPALVFSAETGEGGLLDRFLAHESGIDSLAIKGERRDLVTGEPLPLTDAELAIVDEAGDRIGRMPLYLNFTDINADQVLRNIERVLLENGIPFDSPWVVLFDYLQFGAKLGQETNYERISRLSTEFKNIAKITNHPVIIFSQLTRDSEGMEKPSITMFKESGRIEQDADVAIIISGERVQGKRAPRRLNGVKQREGESQWVVDCVLQQDTCHFVARQGGVEELKDIVADERPGLFE